MLRPVITSLAAGKTRALRNTHNQTSRFRARPNRRAFETRSTRFLNAPIHGQTIRKTDPGQEPGFEFREISCGENPHATLSDPAAPPHLTAFPVTRNKEFNALQRFRPRFHSYAAVWARNGCALVIQHQKKPRREAGLFLLFRPNQASDLPPGCLPRIIIPSRSSSVTSDTLTVPTSLPFFITLARSHSSMTS